jgi:hypothetical protein
MRGEERKGEVGNLGLLDTKVVECVVGEKLKCIFLHECDKSMLS